MILFSQHHELHWVGGVSHLSGLADDVLHCQLITFQTPFSVVGSHENMKTVLDWALQSAYGCPAESCCCKVQTCHQTLVSSCCVVWQVLSSSLGL
jgi:hypothetical protein